MVKKKDILSMPDEDRAFFMSAYRNDPKARKAMDAEMKRLGLTPEQYFGVRSDSPDAQVMNDVYKSVSNCGGVKLVKPEEIITDCGGMQPIAPPKKY